MPKVAPEYKELVRKRIVEAANKLFSEKGYRDTTMDEIASNLGISKAAMYRYFESKEELFKAITEIILRSVKQGMRESFKQASLEPHRFFDAIAKWMWTPILFFDAISESFRNEKLREVMKQSYKSAVADIENFLEEKKKEGVLRKNLNTKLIAMSLIALHDGLLGSEVAGVRREQMEQALSEAIQAIMIGVAASSKLEP